MLVTKGHRGRCTWVLMVGNADRMNHVKQQLDSGLELDLCICVGHKAKQGQSCVDEIGMLFSAKQHTYNDGCF